MTGDRDALAAESKELPLEVLGMPGVAKAERRFCARMAESENSSKTKESKVQTRRRTVDERG